VGNSVGVRATHVCVTCEARPKVSLAPVSALHMLYAW
jgi:hypothetical protein